MATYSIRRIREKTGQIDEHFLLDYWEVGGLVPLNCCLACRKTAIDEHFLQNYLEVGWLVPLKCYLACCCGGLVVHLHSLLAVETSCDFETRCFTWKTERLCYSFTYMICYDNPSLFIHKLVDTISTTMNHEYDSILRT